jgi:hypothetical protein
MSSRVSGRSAANVADRRARDPVEWGVAARCRRGEATSGDLGVVCLLPGGALVAGIDGLGHGAEAARAARRAGDVVRAGPGADLAVLVKRCHTALRGTRGAAISLAFISPAAGGMTWVGVGNVEGRLLSGEPTARRIKGSLALGRGVLGHELPARRRPHPGDRRRRLGLRGLPRHVRHEPGDQRAHPRRALEARGRRARGRGPLPGPANMSEQMQFQAAYASALRDYLRDPAEASLSVAYELAREAVRRELSVLDVAVAHQEALLSALAGAADAADVEGITRAAGDFFLEGLSTFEMVQRGFREARLEVALERRHTELSRRLSTFLADTSLADSAHDSLEEMLRLVTEQARELVGAACCMATVALAGEPRVVEASSYPEGDRRWTTLVRWIDVAETYRLIRSNGGSVRSAGKELARLPAFRVVSGDRTLEGWLAASLTALDGSEMGAIQLFDKHGGPFTAEDESALVHLAQMTAAAVERARLYGARD